MTLDHLHPVLDRIRETQLGQTGVLRDIAETMQALAQQNARYGQELRMLRHENAATRAAIAKIPTLLSRPPSKPTSKAPMAFLFEEGEKRMLRWGLALLMAVHLLKGGDPIALIQMLLKPL